MARILDRIMGNPANDNKKGLQAEGAEPAADLALVPIGRPCPICKKPSIADYRPFCSKRCADVDLSRWLGGTYVIPADAREEDEFAPHQDGDDDHL